DSAVFLCANEETLRAGERTGPDADQIACTQERMRLYARAHCADSLQRLDFFFGHFAGSAGVPDEPANAGGFEDLNFSVEFCLQKQITGEQRQNNQLAPVLPSMHGTVHRQEDVEAFVLEQLRGALFVLKPGVCSEPSQSQTVSPRLACRARRASPSDLHKHDVSQRFSVTGTRKREPAFR